MDDPSIDIDDLRRKVERLKALLVSRGDDVEALEAIKELTQQVRLLLDIGELPKPFQLNALGSADWSLSSDWVKLDVKDGG